jgi:hypothetical protein
MLPVMAKSQPSKNYSGKIIVEEVHLEDIEDDMQPPPTDLTSKFKTVHDWLRNVCQNDKPKKPIAKYKFGLFESANSYTVVLVGVNEYKSKNTTTTRIQFQPKYMYFKLPEDVYKNLKRDQLIDKLSSELKTFASTPTFKSSFFTNANIVVFETNGQLIWSK